MLKFSLQNYFCVIYIFATFFNRDLKSAATQSQMRHVLSLLARPPFTNEKGLRLAIRQLMDFYAKIAPIEKKDALLNPVSYPPDPPTGIVPDSPFAPYIYPRMIDSIPGLASSLAAITRTGRGKALPFTFYVDGEGLLKVAVVTNPDFKKQEGPFLDTGTIRIPNHLGGNSFAKSACEKAHRLLTTMVNSIVKNPGSEFAQACLAFLTLEMGTCSLDKELRRSFYVGDYLLQDLIPLLIDFLKENSHDIKLLATLMHNRGVVSVGRTKAAGVICPLARM